MELLPFVTVYTITYNQRDILHQVLSRLFQQNYPADRWQIIVLDDGSIDGTQDLLAKLQVQSPVPFKMICEIHTADYLSAKRWNQCIAYGFQNTDVFIQIDDVLTQPDLIRQHIKWHLQSQDFLVTGAKFEGKEENWLLSTCLRANLANQDGGAAEIPFYTAVWGASLSFTKSLMRKVYHPPYECPFDERMIGWGHHEVELALRMRNAGCQIIYDPAAGVFHRDHTSESEQTRGINRSDLVKQGDIQNTDYILSKHHLSQLERW